MAFVKEYKNIMEELAEWEYLTEIGVRNMFGKPIMKGTRALVVDREKNYFLIPQGHTNINRDDVEIHFYALCLDGIVLNMEVTENERGRASDSSYECHYIIEKIKFPESWTYSIISKEELIKIITDAFTVRTYNKLLTPEKVKALSVTVESF